jgi:filamentous hemagglutinin
MLVATSTGYLEIRDIRPGQLVWSRDALTGAMGYKPALAQYSNPYAETVYISVRDGETGTVQEIVSNRIHPFFVSVPEGARVPPGAEGHDYEGEIDDGAWVDADDLAPGFRLLEADGGWSEVVSVRIARERLQAYNLTIADWHTYFVKAGFDGASDAVWVHNNCGPELNRQPSRAVDQKTDEINNDPDKIGKTYEAGDGRVTIDGQPGNPHEVQIALEIAEATGKVVRVKGDGAGGVDGTKTADLEIDGKPFEVKKLESRTSNAAVDNIGAALQQAPNALIDGRSAGLSKGTAMQALRRWQGSDKFDPTKSVTIYTSQGRVRYVPGKGILGD